jgi:hypothetical protein
MRLLLIVLIFGFIYTAALIVALVPFIFMALTRGWRKIGTALDQLVNAATGGNPDETISSRAGKLLELHYAYGLRMPLWARVVVWVTHQIEDDHTLRSIERDEA